MRRSHALRSVTALCLLSLLGALGTGLPSHAHTGSDQQQVERGQHVSASDHHSHGTRLVEQDERAPSGGLLIAAIARVVAVAQPAAASAGEPADTQVLRPRERAPPPGAPRAPPFLT